MRAVITYLQGISIGLFSAFHWLWDALTEQVYFLRLMQSFLGNFAVYFSWLPPSIIAILVYGFALVVVMRIFKY